jgi:LmbE family N-acetylglucosaminyl deacetylase
MPPVPDEPGAGLAGRPQATLVLASHCDDESLGAGGLIHVALQAGMEVRVVIATNGDGFIFATMEDFRRVYPRHQDFIRMGQLRQDESLQALEDLGLPPGQVTFLSYPDRGTDKLWNNHWSEANPYHSPYNGQTRSPYERTYNPRAVYAGEDLLADLESILVTYRPDLIVYPHPDDIHPDHWGLSAFTRLAVSFQQHRDPAYQPEMLAFLVHRPDFPALQGYHPEASLLPPEKLYSLYPDWLRFDLEPETVAQKRQAVDSYRSQRPLLHTLLDSFVRQNELFARVEPAGLSSLSDGNALDPSTWIAAGEQPLEAIQGDPVRDFITRRALASADLTATYLARGPDNVLYLCAGVRGRVERSLIYSLHILAAGQDGVVHWSARSRAARPGDHLAQLHGRYACAQASLSELGDPWSVFVGADVEETGLGILDQVAWQIVKIQPDGPPS